MAKTKWICSLCEKETTSIHWMESDESLCDECLEGRLSEDDEPAARDHSQGGEG